MTTWRQVAHQLRDLAIELLYPPRCEACKRMGVAFCSQCLAAIAPLLALRCPRCDRPIETPVHHHCSDCVSLFPSLKGLRVYAPYQTPLKEAIHTLKYRSFAALARPLGEKLVEAWQERGIDVTGVLPVPLHPQRVRERGYNQSALLAEILCDTLQLPFYDNLLKRVRPTRPQVGLDRQARLQNVADAFEATQSTLGGTWLLVDDVCTSGATLEASAAALRAAGADEVWAMVLARPVHLTDHSS